MGVGGRKMLDEVRPFLELAALVLGIVNGVYIWRHYRRDRPKINVSFSHPELYQWWFRLPPGEKEGKQTRRFGFLLYVGISNSGLRTDTLATWHLRVPLQNLRQPELKPLNIPPPVAKLPTGDAKVFHVLGQITPMHTEDLAIEPGRAIGGMAYYHLEVYGSAAWDPSIIGGKIRAELVVRTVLGQHARAPVTLHEVPLSTVQEMVPGIERLPG